MSIGAGWSGELTLLHVSYDPTRELFKAYNAQFAAYYQQAAGQRVTVSQSHGGSGKQARSVIDGLRADVVSLALAYDVQAIADHHLIQADWATRLDHAAAPFTSTIMFLVRKGNPKRIRDWDDLTRPDVKVITPNPKTSGGARWNFLAAWGYVTLGRHENDAAAREFIVRLYKNVPVLDTGARGATTTFVQRGIGDVCVAWENEAELALKEYGRENLELVYPSLSILAQPTVAVVDRNVDRRGPAARAAAEAYVKHLYAEASQVLIAQHGYRPVATNLPSHAVRRFPALRLFTVKDVAGDWNNAQKRFFGEDGVFDQLYRP